ncbi:MAG: hypothetical protein KF809_11445 [Chloroflexi bacterium]|nr:hypothetical protein [Chloroflexota bacterium]
MSKVADREPVTKTGREHPCPRCGSRAVASIMYGMPMFSEDLQKSLDTGELALGGCVVWDDQPDLRCNTCDHSYRMDGLRTDAVEGDSDMDQVDA